MPKSIAARDRFERYIYRTDACWIWKGAKSPGGYGQFKVNGRHFNAHRWYYMELVGPVPEGWHVDHLCRVKLCVNPAHLEAVTPQVNTLRADGPSAINARKTHCKRGHEFTAENTRHRVSRYGHPVRVCRECQREADRIRYRRDTGRCDGRDR